MERPMPAPPATETPPAPEGMFLLAFVDVMESKRAAGDLLGWRITRDDRYCWLEIMSVEGLHVVGRGATFDQARQELADKLILAGMEGAASA